MRNKETAERSSHPPFVLSVTAFVLLSRSGYEGLTFPADSWYWPCTWKSDLERKSTECAGESNRDSDRGEGINVCLLCVCADVYSTCLCLFARLVCDKCLVWLHLCVHVWISVMGARHVGVYAPRVCVWGRNERQESHLLWCNDCAIWRQERFGAGAAGTSPGDLLAFLLSPSDRCVNSIISKGPE